MKEYIEREALIKETTEYCDNDPWGFMRGPMEAERRKRYFKLFRLVVQKFPAADAAEVRHGQWENAKCTACAFDLRELTDGENDLEQWVWDEGLPYCPNCGAKMDKEE